MSIFFIRKFQVLKMIILKNFNFKKYLIFRSKSVPPLYRTYRIFDPKKRQKNEPEKSKISSSSSKPRTKVMNLKVLTKKQRTLTGNFQKFKIINSTP